MKILFTDNIDVINEPTSAGVNIILEALYPTVSGGAHQMRFTNPASTLPGPHSTMRVAPRALSQATHSTQRTGECSWATSASTPACR